MSMTNYPIASSSSTASCSTAGRDHVDSNYILRASSHDCRSRDIKRRLEVIQKKMSDLQELGVACGFCYVSVRNSGTLFTMGNQAITQAIEQSRDAILQELSKGSPKETHPSDGKQIHMLLPPLPAPLDELGLQDLRGLVVGIVKDLGLKWSDSKPSFWPREIPFQYPRTAPDGFQGCWTKALREIIKSIYTYYNYNPDTHCWNNMSTEISSSITQGENDEEEEVDVGTPDEEMHLTITDQRGSSNKIGADDLSDAETISVCSGGDSEDKQVVGQAISYFGYEIAQSESSRSSPHPSSEHEESNDQIMTDSTNGLRTMFQPKLIYCDPRIYTQLYPQIPAATPILLPSVFMKQLYSTRDRTASPGHAQTTDKARPASTQPLFFSFPKGVPARVGGVGCGGASHKRERETKQDDCEERQQRGHTPLLPENKSRKSKNGIYIYTNPTAPLQFMSLNSRKNPSGDQEKEETPLTRKLIAGAPVSPHTGEPVIMKDSGYHLHVMKQESDDISSNCLPIPSPPTSSPPRKGPGGNSKKRRELVFHWYKSPEVPVPKRPKVVESS